LLDAAADVKRWSSEPSGRQTVLEIEGSGITAARVADLIGPAGYHVLGEETVPRAAERASEQPSSYYPLLLILMFLLGVVALIEITAASLDPMRAMRHFMAGFFLVFSFFKLLDLRAFADAYGSYDIVARKWPLYGLVYPFIELALGIAYLVHAAPIATNSAAVIVMCVSSLGVVKAVVGRQKIRCACLGTVFNLPMSVVTLIEDGLMLTMSAAMLMCLV
jgi:hypothetical protein